MSTENWPSVRLQGSSNWDTWHAMIHRMASQPPGVWAYINPELSEQEVTALERPEYVHDDDPNYAQHLNMSALNAYDARCTQLDNTRQQIEATVPFQFHEVFSCDVAAYGMLRSLHKRFCPSQMERKQLVRQRYEAIR
ncbi:hypothetical protein BDY21DRAFT_114341 [Lineolata rhizophorae]|uniref:Uncharacterized protein n=1 Tax=Lineolata rhizophorae TaxID=578093 RepID=A0A6A6NR48_9PEZI|nr:hypothetical protein BDY21DRAFT_114341 [Lineolata rhizophorae]